jgi:hypothetical protein
MGKNCYICSAITTLFLSIFILVYGLQYHLYMTYESNQCLITHVIYPTKLPPNNNIGFVDCDCGKYCTSDLGTCISIYGTLINNDDNILFQKNIVPNDFDSECTFREKDCPDGEQISDRIQAVNNAVQEANTYLEKKINNQTIDCYSKDNNLYLEKDFDVVTFFVFVGITILFFLIAICGFLSLYMSKRKKEKERKTEIYNPSFKA